MDMKAEQTPLFEIPPQGDIIQATGETAFEIVNNYFLTCP
jgi:predicted proteasome-type protease